MENFDGFLMKSYEQDWTLSEKLYKEVWKEPMTVVSKRYDVTDVALSKTCKKLKVPKPHVGYWAKVQAGQKPKKPPLPNQKGEHELAEYAVSVDEVEAFTGIDFYPSLEDDQEEALESSFDVSLWPFKQFRQSDYEDDYEEQQAASEEVGALYWINTSNNTRHNSGCRYYGKTKNGYYTNEEVGEACGTCGG